MWNPNYAFSGPRSPCSYSSPASSRCTWPRRRHPRSSSPLRLQKPLRKEVERLQSAFSVASRTVLAFPASRLLQEIVEPPRGFTRHDFGCKGSEPNLRCTLAFRATKGVEGFGYGSDVTRSRPAAGSDCSTGDNGSLQSPQWTCTEPLARHCCSQRTHPQALELWYDQLAV